MKAYRNPPNVHPPVAAYTHQIELSRDERLLVLSGQIGQREDGTVPEDPIEQLEVAWENLRRNLQAAAMDVKRRQQKKDESSAAGNLMRRQPRTVRPIRPRAGSIVRSWRTRCTRCSSSRCSAETR